jgi:serine/threonine protein kinase
MVSRSIGSDLKANRSSGKGRDLQSGQDVAMKLEEIKFGSSFLRDEIEIYDELAGGPGVPRVYWHGEECEFKIMVFELLGPNLEDLFRYCGRMFSLKTVLMLADQLIHRFQLIHSKGYVHRDIKPANLLMGDGLQGNTVYVADIGLAKEIREPTVVGGPGGRHAFAGTVCYASSNAHLSSGEHALLVASPILLTYQVELFPRDDMESLGFVLIHFLRGGLPWQNVDDETGSERASSFLSQNSRPQVMSFTRDFPGSLKSISNTCARFATTRHPSTHICATCLPTSFAARATSMIASLTGPS